ncbi:MAG TPA: DUF2267 domain-containing protein [Ruania sp.]|nr:DUF2267 domain-containing protein [Ruania sp.]
MQYDELITAIRDRGRFLSDEQATAAAAAVLGVLSTRDLGGEAERLAAQLPDGIGELLLAEERAVERFDSEEFLHRIQQRLGGSAADAELATRAVMSTIVDAVSDGEKVAFVNQLPLGYSQFCFEQVS